jgi:hypothetical protein
MIINRRFATRGMECRGAFAAFSNGRRSRDRQLRVDNPSSPVHRMSLQGRFRPANLVNTLPCTGH